MSIPAGTKFIGINPTVNMEERKSEFSNSITEVYTIEDINSNVVLPLVYSAVLTQSGPLPPNSSVIYSDFNTPEFNRVDVGIYDISFEGGTLPIGKTEVCITNGGFGTWDGVAYAFSLNNGSMVRISTIAFDGNYKDSVLTNANIIIKVYP